MWEILSPLVNEATVALKSNAFFTGGAMLGFLGVILASLRKFPGELYRWFVSRISFEATLYEYDASFGWMCIWLAEHPYTAKRARRYLTVTQFSRDKFCNIAQEFAQNTNYMDDSDLELEPKICLVPSWGWHLLWYKKRPLLITLVEETPEGNSGSRRKSVNIKSFGLSRAHFKEFVSNLTQFRPHSMGRTVPVFLAYGNRWQVLRETPERRLESVVMPKEDKDHLVRDLETFFNQKDWYQNLGIPYRRGYLLHGPPGNGKSSLALAIASHFKRPVYVLPLSSVKAEAALLDLMSNVAVNAVLLIEDIDCLYGDRKRVEANHSEEEFSGFTDEGEILAQEVGSGSQFVSLAAFLNALDGVVATEGRVLIMTTNYPERLDAALIRPGRCDFRLAMLPPQGESLLTMIRNFYVDSEDSEHQEIFRRVSAYATELSAAQLQALFVRYREVSEFTKDWDTGSIQLEDSFTRSNNTNFWNRLGVSVD